MLRVARRLGRARPVTVATTFLGAHALPPEYAGRPDDYIELVCNTMLPTLAHEGLIDAVDVFCESIGFTRSDCRRVKPMPSPYFAKALVSPCGSPSGCLRPGGKGGRASWGEGAC